MGGPGSGRKPKPTALKLLRGTRADRINHDEPKAPAGIPERPDYVTGPARELWDRLAPMLGSMGVLTLADREALALLCDSFRQWREEPDNMKRRAEYARLLGEFGLTPSSRGRIRVGGQGPKDDLGEFLKRKRG